ncbi:oxalate:formate antiporter [Vibrio maritimus]|uniref:oxalate:formate antiporter n=1 Tax=Vibrio maritimus TaxID=990268 RepID=UPI003734E565
MNYPTTLPGTHKAVLNTIIEVLSADSRLCGIAASGSYGSNKMDEYSDLDLVIAIHPNDYQEVFEQRFEIVSQIEGYTAGFSGEHVGEPRLIVSIFAPDAIHVDFKFVSLPDAANRVDDCAVLWEKGTLLTDVFATAVPAYPRPDPQWIEDRFWIWTHYAATKIARGEYFETLELLSFLRQNVLSPLALKQAGLTPSGVRTIEKRLPEFAEKLAKTVATVDKQSLILAFKQCVSLYLELRDNEFVERNDRAQELCYQYFQDKFGH